MLLGLCANLVVLVLCAGVSAMFAWIINTLCISMDTQKSSQSSKAAN